MLIKLGQSCETGGVLVNPIRIQISEAGRTKALGLSEYPCTNNCI